MLFVTPLGSEMEIIMKINNNITPIEQTEMRTQAYTPLSKEDIKNENTPAASLEISKAGFDKLNKKPESKPKTLDELREELRHKIFNRVDRNYDIYDFAPLMDKVEKTLRDYSKLYKEEERNFGEIYVKDSSAEGGKRLLTKREYMGMLSDAFDKYVDYFIEKEEKMQESRKEILAELSNYFSLDETESEKQDRLEKIRILRRLIKINEAPEGLASMIRRAARGIESGDSERETKKYLLDCFDKNTG